MSNVVSRHNANIPAEFKELFGPPPLQTPRTRRFTMRSFAGLQEISALWTQSDVFSSET
jgi:hypothetical protein